MPGSNYGTGEAIAPENTSNVQTQPVFDPNAGKQAAYDNRWKEYLTELGKQKKRININKAQKYFNSQFEQDWNNGAASRQIDFISQQARQKQQSIIDKWRFERAEADRISQEQDALDYEAAGYTYDATTGKWNKPEVNQGIKPKSFNTNYWLTEAQKVNPEFKSIQDVKNWQTANGLVADGKFGDKSLAKWNNLNAQDTNPHEGGGSMRHVYNPSNQGEDNVLVTGVKNPFSSKTFNTAGKAFTGTFNTMEEFNDAFTDWYGERNGFWSFGKNNSREWDAARDNMLSEYLKYNNLTSLPNAQKPKSSSNNVVQPWRVVAAHKNGGNVNKYQQGGNMNDKELQKAFMTYLIEDAAAQGMQIQTEQDLQAYAQQLGEEGLKAKYQEFMQKMQGGVKAKLGAKLDYINKLKGNCPEGEELVYMKEGGRVCPKCVKKAKGGTQAPEEKKRQNTIKQWKEDRAKAKDEAARDSIAINKYNDQETMINKGHKGKFNPKKKTSTGGATWEPDRSKYEKAKKNACGAKMKKK